MIWNAHVAEQNSKQESWKGIILEKFFLVSKRYEKQCGCRKSKWYEVPMSRSKIQSNNHGKVQGPHANFFMLVLSVSNHTVFLFQFENDKFALVSISKSWNFGFWNTHPCKLIDLFRLVDLLPHYRPHDTFENSCLSNFEIVVEWMNNFFR